MVAKERIVRMVVCLITGLKVSIHDFLVEEDITRPVVGPAIGYVENQLIF